MSAEKLLSLLSVVSDVNCPECKTRLILRHFEAVEAQPDLYFATFRCPRCAKDTKCEIKARPATSESA